MVKYMNNKVVIIGCGNVGLSCAYALINGNSNVDSLVLIDIKREKLLGEIMDLNHAVPSTNFLFISATIHNPTERAIIGYIPLSVSWNNNAKRKIMKMIPSLLNARTTFLERSFIQ